MIQETGTVTGVQGEFATVEAERTGSCKHCSSKGMCGTIDSAANKVTICALNEAGAKVGDIVIVGIPGKSFLHASLLVYTTPILALIVGGGLGSVAHRFIGDIISKDALSALFALVFIVASVFYVKSKSGKIDSDSRYTPIIMRIIS